MSSYWASRPFLKTINGVESWKSKNRGWRYRARVTIRSITHHGPVRDSWLEAKDDRDELYGRRAKARS
jgi:hypothetical protein